MPETTTGRELVLVPPQPRTKHSPVVLWPDKAMVYERALKFAAGYLLPSAPQHARALEILAEELHNYLLGGGPPLDPEMAYEILTQTQPAPLRPTSRSEAADAAMAPTVLVGPGSSPVLPDWVDQGGADPTEQYGWPPAQPSRMQRFRDWFTGGGS
jgi:hypothetical protein